MVRKRRKDGLYAQQVTINGKAKTFYTKTQKELAQKILNYEEKEKQGKLFKEVVDEWEDEHFATLSSNTIKSYTTPKRRTVEQFGEPPVKEITPSMVNAHILSFSKRRYARKTVSNQLLVLNLIFDKSVLEGYMEYSSCEAIRLPKNLPPTPRMFASDDDVKILNESLDTHPFALTPFLLFILDVEKEKYLR